MEGNLTDTAEHCTIYLTITICITDAIPLEQSNMFLFLLNTKKPFRACQWTLENADI